MKTPRILTTTIAALLCAAPFTARAVTDTWDGGGGDNNFSTGANWADNTAPVSDSTATDLIFVGTTRLTPNQGALLFGAKSITFNNTAGAFTIGGNTLSIGAGGIVNNDSQTQTFDALVNFNTQASATINAAAGGLTFLKDVIMSDITLTVAGLGLVTIASTSTLAVDDGKTLQLNTDFLVKAGTLSRTSAGTIALAAGTVLGVEGGGDVTITGAFTNATASTISLTGAGSTFHSTASNFIEGGSTFNVLAGAALTTGSNINLGGGGGNSTLLVDGAGSSAGGGQLRPGLNGQTGTVTFRNSATGSFTTIQVDVSTSAGSNGVLNVESGATLTAGSLLLASNAVANTGAITLTGAGSAITITGAGTATIGAASASSGTLTVNTGATFTTGTGTTTVNATGFVDITGGTFTANGDLTLNGGTLERDSAGTLALAAGTTFTIQTGGRATFDFPFTQNTASTITVTGAGSELTTPNAPLEFAGGGTANVLAGADVSAASSVSISGTTGDGTMLVDGAGSSLSASGLNIGRQSHAGSLTFSNGSTGAFSTIDVLDGGTTGTSGALSILSGADVTGAALTVGNVASITNGGTTTIDGAGSTLTITGAGTATIGSADPNGSVGTLTVQNSGVFTTGTGTTTINATGTVNVNGGTLSMLGDTTVTGLLTRDAIGAFTLAAGKTLTAQAGGDVTITGAFTNSTASTITVTGAGSTFASTSTLTLAGGGATNVLAGGSVSAAATLSLGGASGGNTVSVDGTGSQLGATALNVGLSGATASLTFKSNATGSFTTIGVDASTVAGTNGTLTIQSGADVTGTALNLAQNPFANTGAITVTGSGSTLTITGAGTATIGAASASTGTLNVNSSGTFTTGTGATTLNPTGTLNVTGGILNVNGTVVRAGGALNFNSGTINVAVPFVADTGGLLGANPVLDSGNILTTMASATVAAGRTLAVNGGTLNLLGDTTVSGLLTRDATGTLTLAAGGALTAQAGGDVTITGDFTHNAASTITVSGSGSSFTTSGNHSIATGATMNVQSSGTFAPAGNVTITGGLLTRDATGVFTLAAGRTLTAQSGGEVAITGDFTHNTASTITVTGSGSSFTTSGNHSIATGATMNVQSSSSFAPAGDVTVNGGLLTRGTTSVFTLAAGRTLTAQAGGDVTITGAFANGGGSLFSVSGAGSTFTASGGVTFTGGSDVTVAAGGTFGTGTGGASTFSSGSAITINGGTFSSGDDLTLSGATLTRDATGTLSIAPNRVFSVESGGSAVITGSFALAGGAYFNVSGTTTTASVSDALTVTGNSGILQINQGTFTSGTGLASFGSGTDLRIVNGGKYISNGNLTLDGATLTHHAGSTLTLSADTTMTLQGGSGADITGPFTQTAGSTVTVTGTGSIFNTSGNHTIAIGATMNVLSGGAFAPVENVTINGGLLTRDATGVFNLAAGKTLTAQSGGDVMITGAFDIGGASTFTVTGTGSTLTVNGTGTTTIGAAGSGTLSVSSGGLFDGSTGTTTLNAAGSLVVSGAGSVARFDGPFTHGGAISVGSGSLVRFLGSSVTGTNGFTGTGTVEFGNSCIYNPGTAPVAVSFGGNLAASGQLSVQIGGTTPGTQHDKLTVAGAVTLDTLLVSMEFTNNFAPTTGQTFDIIDGATLTGSVSGGVSSGLLPGWEFSVDEIPAQGIVRITSLNDAISTSSAFIWDGGGTDPNLATAANWAGDVAPPSDLVNTVIAFDGFTQTAPNVSAPFSAKGLWFLEDAGEFSIGGQPLSIGALGIYNGYNFGTSQTFTCAVDFSGVATSRVFSDYGDVSFSGTVTLPTGTLRLEGNTTISLGNVVGTGTIEVANQNLILAPTSGVQQYDIIFSGVVETVPDGSTDVFGSSASITNDSGILTIREDLTLDGAAFTVDGSGSVSIGDFGSAPLVRIQAGSDMDLSAGFGGSIAADVGFIVNGAGSTLLLPTDSYDFSTVQALAGGSISIAQSVIDSRDTVVDGTGSSLVVTGTFFVNESPNDPEVDALFSNGATATFTTLDNSDQMRIASGASVTTVDFSNQSGGELEITGTGSRITATGAGSYLAGNIAIRAGGELRFQDSASVQSSTLITLDHGTVRFEGGSTVNFRSFDLLVEGGGSSLAIFGGTASQRFTPDIYAFDAGTVLDIQGTVASGQGEISDGAVVRFLGELLFPSNSGFFANNNNDGTIEFHGGISYAGDGTEGSYDFYTSVLFGPTNTLTLAVAGLGSFDRFVVAGATLTFGGKLKIVLENGFVPGLGDTFAPVGWGGTATGTFASFDLPVLPAGRGWDLSSLYITGEISVVAISGVEQWRVDKFGTAAYDPEAADLADPEGDGNENLLEYALGLDPLAPSTAGLPVQGTVTIGPDTFLTITFTRPLAVTDIDYLIEVGSAPNAFLPGSRYGVSGDVPNNATTTQVSRTIGATTETIVVRDNTPMAGAGSRMIRLKVTNPLP